MPATGEEAIEARKARERITLNGEEVLFNKEQSFPELLVSLGIDPDSQGLAVAVNAEVVPRTEWKNGNFTLKPHDKVEIIHAVSGG